MRASRAAQNSGRAIIFDCDGVLADTERFAHLPAFNAMFEEFDLPVRWSEAEYGHLLLIGGGKERLRTLLTDEFVVAARLPRSWSDQQALVQQWHERKTAIYAQLVRAGAVPARAGIVRIVNEARSAGWSLAVASTSAGPAVQAVLDSVIGSELASRFQVFAGDLVSRKKPAPDIYTAAIDHLGLPKHSTIAIEDTRNGLLAATSAGLACVVTTNDQSRNEDLTEAILVVDSLGDPDGEQSHVMANRGRARPGRWITLADLVNSMPIGVSA